MSCSELQLLHRICIYVFHPCLCLFHTIGNVHSCRVAKNESSLFSSSLSSDDPKSFILCCFSRFNHSRGLLYISSKYFANKQKKEKTKKEILVWQTPTLWDTYPILKIWREVFSYSLFISDCISRRMVKKFVICLLSSSFEWIILNRLLLGRSLSPSRHSIRQTSVSFEVIPGLCRL